MYGAKDMGLLVIKQDQRTSLYIIIITLYGLILFFQGAFRSIPYAGDQKLNRASVGSAQNNV